MRLSLLEKREDVIKVLVKSINQFFLEYFPNMEIRASLEPNGGDTFYGNKYLNFFASDKITSSAFQVIVNEYSHTRAWWRRFLQICYVQIAITPFFFKRHYHYVFFLKAPSDCEVHSWLFLGGNSRVRIIDSLNDRSIIVLKDGYPKKMIANEADFRRKNNIEILPDTIKIGSRFITESLVPGVPINRLKSQDERNKLRTYAYRQLYKEIASPGIFFDGTYLKLQIENINGMLGSLDLTRLSVSEDLIQSFIGIEVPIAQVHGDLQDANIILTNQGVKIIDLEATRRGSIWYDYITLFCGVRNGKSVDQIEKWIYRASSWKLLRNQVKDKGRIQIQHDMIFITFMLEELAYGFDYIFVDKRRLVPQRLMDILVRIDKWIRSRR